MFQYLPVKLILKRQVCTLFISSVVSCSLVIRIFQFLMLCYPQNWLFFMLFLILFFLHLSLYCSLSISWDALFFHIDVWFCLSCMSCPSSYPFQDRHHNLIFHNHRVLTMMSIVAQFVDVTTMPTLLLFTSGNFVYMTHPKTLWNRFLYTRLRFCNAAINVLFHGFIMNSSFFEVNCCFDWWLVGNGFCIQ